MVKIAALSLLILLAACQTTGGSFCSISQPIRPSQVTINAMSDAEVAVILSHNLKGKRLCGWRE